MPPAAWQTLSAAEGLPLAPVCGCHSPTPLLPLLARMSVTATDAKVVLVLVFTSPPERACSSSKHSHVPRQRAPPPSGHAQQGFKGPAMVTTALACKPHMHRVTARCCRRHPLAAS